MSTMELSSQQHQKSAKELSTPDLESLLKEVSSFKEKNLAMAARLDQIAVKSAFFSENAKLVIQDINPELEKYTAAKK